MTFNLLLLSWEPIHENAYRKRTKKNKHNNKIKSLGLISQNISKLTKNGHRRCFKSCFVSTEKHEIKLL